MGHSEAADLLQRTLDEEKATDEKLTALAEGGINQEAAEAAHPNGQGEDGNEEASARKKPARMAAAKKPARRR
jgi:hypothetical protein